MEERIVSHILLIEKVMMTIKFLQSSVEGADISRIERITALKKLSNYNSNIYSMMGEKSRNL
jgi:hypothetical protein